MHLTIFAFIPLAAAPLAALALLWTLRRVLPPRAQLASGQAAPSTPCLAGKHLSIRWNSWTIQVLPPLVAIIVLALTIWPFAYLGWGFFALLGDPAATRIHPPWFASVWNLFALGVGSAIVMTLAVVVDAVFVLALGCLGRWMIWPHAGHETGEKTGIDPRGDDK